MSSVFSFGLPKSKPLVNQSNVSESGHLNFTIGTPYSLSLPARTPSNPHWAHCARKTTSAVRAAAVDGRDSRLAHDRRHRQNDGLRPWDGRTLVWPR